KRLSLEARYDNEPEKRQRAALALRQAGSDFQEARDILKKLTDAPQPPAGQRDPRYTLAKTCAALGALWLELYRQEGEGHKGERAAKKVYAEALALYQDLVSKSPAVPEYREHLARLQFQRGYLFWRLKDFNRTSEALADALKWQQKLADD